uniref:LRRCT domain-containing protein n=1 Tax=Onchocerca volvulus TaxID=6282 RepID=A0A8R1XVR3_ONCVO
MSKLLLLLQFILQMSFLACVDICQYCRCDQHSYTVTCTGHNILLRSVIAPHWAKTLYFHHMSMRHLPHFVHAENIKILRINFCGLTHIHSLSLISLPNLETLHLADNLLADLPSECFFELTKLRIVNLARNLIYDLNLISEVLPRSHILEQFSIDGNPIQISPVHTQLPLARQLHFSDINMEKINDSTITFLPSIRCNASETLCRSMHISNQQWFILRTLDLSFQEELEIHPSLLQVVSNVTTLNLGTTKLPDSFPTWLQISSHVRHLSIPFTVLPNTNHSWEWCGEHLEWLDISHINLRTLIIPRHCKIRYLKANDNHLDKVLLLTTSLEVLFLERNYLSSWILPPSGTIFNHMLTLSLSSNKIRYLPENALAHYPQLQYLDISQNVLANLSNQSFPPIGMQIRSINMSHNKLSRFVHPILPSLQYLDLSSNALEGLDPHLLTGLPLLQHFYLSSNVRLFSKCKRVSECWIMSLNQLGNLIDLGISDCNLEWQPDFSSFQAMRKLDLSRNQLLSLDGALLPRNLHYLDVSQNLIHHLYNSTCMKSELREMDISRNPLICHCTLLEINQWIPNDTYSTSTSNFYYCFSGSWQYPLRSYLDTVTECLPVDSINFSVWITVICPLLITIFLIVFIFVTNKRLSQCGKYLSFAYKPLHTTDTSVAVGI